MGDAKAVAGGALRPRLVSHLRRSFGFVAGSRPSRDRASLVPRLRRCFVRTVGQRCGGSSARARLRCGYRLLELNVSG